VATGLTLVLAPCDCVGECLGQQRCLRVHWRQIFCKKIGEGLVKAADQIARVGFQCGHGIMSSAVG